jgi:protein-S-isoprenylcysteine O-methyltransferase Ste14
MMLLLTGEAVALGSLTPWLVIPAFLWLIMRWFIIPEERKLKGTFGEQYAEYKRKVRW